MYAILHKTKDFAMKKNILIVQSLVLIPLITPSLTLGMEISHKKITGKSELKQIMPNEEIEALQSIVKEQHIPVFAELIKKFEGKTDNESKDTEVQTTSVNLILSEIETINVAMPECMSTPKNVVTPIQEQPNALVQSVMLPTEKKGLSFFKSFSYKTSTANQVLKSVIYELETSTFDTKNLTSFEILEEAITTATNNKDAKSLITIATLCEEKYPKTIRISDNVAEQASQVITAHYMTELNIKNEELNNKAQERRQQWNTSTLACVKTINDAISTYNQNVQNIADNYNKSVEQKSADTEHLRTQIKTFSLLNREIRGDITGLLINNKIKQPKNILAKTMGQSTSELNSIVTALNRIPKILEFESKPTNILTIENK
jgi:hypothetical protein